MATLVETPADIAMSPVSQPETEPEAKPEVEPATLPIDIPEAEQPEQSSAEKNAGEVNLNSSRPTFQLRCEEHTGAHRFGFCLDCNQVSIC